VTAADQAHGPCNAISELQWSKRVKSRHRAIIAVEADTARCDDWWGRWSKRMAGAVMMMTWAVDIYSLSQQRKSIYTTEIVIITTTTATAQVTATTTA
jgi:hypothetical protein